MSTITFICPHCSHSVNLPANLVGQRGKCPSCQQVVTIVAATTGDHQQISEQHYVPQQYQQVPPPQQYQQVPPPQQYQQVPVSSGNVRKKEGLVDVLLPRGRNSTKEINWPLRVCVGIFFLIVAVIFSVL